MEKIEKMHIMDRLVQELEDVTTTHAFLLKKIAQMEAENIDLGNTLLENTLPAIHEKIDNGLFETASVRTAFIAERNRFVRENKLDEALPQMRF